MTMTLEYNGLAFFTQTVYFITCQIDFLCSIILIFTVQKESNRFISFNIKFKSFEGITLLLDLFLLSYSGDNLCRIHLTKRDID